MRNRRYSILPQAHKVLMVADPGQAAAPNNGQISQQDYEAALNTARQEAAKKAREETEAQLRGQIDHERTQRTSAQAELDRLKKENEERIRAGMEPLQRVEAQMRDLQSTLDRTTAESTAAQARLQAEVEATRLTAYRERVLRAYNGEIFDTLVFGASESAIDEAARKSHEEWKKVRADAHAQAMAAIQASQPQQQPPPVQLQPQYPTVALPPNPAYTQPQYNPGYPQGFPTPTNAGPVTEAPPLHNLHEMTSEEAVRTGQYGGEVRKQILSQLSGGGYQPHLGNAPRHMQPPVQYQQVPGGAQQPMGNPSGPVANPQMYQPAPQQQQQVQPGQQQVVPQQQFPQQQPGQQYAYGQAPKGTPITQVQVPQQTVSNGAASQSAAEAVARQHQNSGVPSHAPTSAFDARFTPTPPVNPNPQQAN